MYLTHGTYPLVASILQQDFNDVALPCATEKWLVLQVDRETRYFATQIRQLDIILSELADFRIDLPNFYRIVVPSHKPSSISIEVADAGALLIILVCCRLDTLRPSQLHVPHHKLVLVDLPTQWNQEETVTAEGQGKDLLFVITDSE